MTRRSPDLRRYYEFVAERAGQRCEYCHAPEAFFPNRFTVDHIVPRSRGGITSADNLALCCFACQQQKLAFESAADPATGLTQPLFDPRRHRWARHFRWSSDGLHLYGMTRTGRATVERLRLNHSRQVEARKRWRKHPDLFP
jgi:hypothetical protein